MYERSSCCHKRYLSLKHRQGAIVTKLPDEKPLKMVGCFSPWAKKKKKVAIWYLQGFQPFMLSKHAQNMPLATISYQKSCFRSAHGHECAQECSRSAKNGIERPQSTCFMSLKLVQVMIVTQRGQIGHTAASEALFPRQPARTRQSPFLLACVLYPCTSYIKWTIHLHILHIPHYDVMGGWLVRGSRQKGICVGKKHELWPHALYILKHQHYNMMYWYPIVTVSIAIY